MDTTNDYDENKKVYLYQFPDNLEFWNSNISNVSMLDHVKVASCVSAAKNVKRVCLVLIITSSTTIRDILEDWWKIASIRDNIASAYGDYSKSELVFHNTAYRLHEEYHMSYKDIADFLNFEILFLLTGIDLIPTDIHLNGDDNSSGFEDCLISFGISSEEAREWSKFAEENINKEKFPWLPESGPITRSMVREKVRQFKDKVDNHGLSIDWMPSKLKEFSDLESINKRKALLKLWEKSYGIQDFFENRFVKWNKLRTEIYTDWSRNLVTGALNPIDVGKIKTFFP